MIEMRLDTEALVRFLENQNLNRRDDEDLGYGIHAWLSAAFGKLSPKPFRLFLDIKARRSTRILAYSRHPNNELIDHLERFAEPGAFAVCPPDMISSKPMALTWPKGSRLSFEALVCPISRKNGHEKDIFLRLADRLGAEADLKRHDAYAEWIQQQVTDAMHLIKVRLDAFRLIRVYRRKKGSGSGKIIRPQALLSGGLEIIDADAFHKVLERGIGRHRAFGYGMLLLKSR